LTPSSGGSTPVNVEVSILVTGANNLTVAPSGVSFDYTTGSTNPPPAIAPVTSSSGSLRFEAVDATTGSNNWLRGGRSSPYTSANLTISVAPQTLAAGTCSGTVLVTSDDATNGQQNISVTLIMTAATSFVASPSGLVFSYQMTLDTSGPQVFAVQSHGAPAQFNITTSTSSGGNWLSVVGAGTTPASVVAAVNAGALGPGTYNGSIQINPTDPPIPVLQAPAILNISPSPVFLLAANQVAFRYQTNGPMLPSQKVTINATGNSPLVYYPTTLTADGGSWLSAAPDIGVTPPDLTVSVNPSGLTPGLYYGPITIIDPAGETPTSFVPVALQSLASSLPGRWNHERRNCARGHYG
jgi:hypothetical protein